MPLLSVDETKCKRDGNCVAECPRSIITLEVGESVPTPVQGAEELCIRCGHCVAVCPHGAMSLSFMKPGDCPAVDRKKLPDREGVELLLHSRRSIRTYQDQDVGKDVLQELINVARYAPTGMNRQDVEWLAVASRKGVSELAGKAIDWMRFLVNRNEPIAERFNMQGIVDGWEDGIDFICRRAAGLIITHAPADFASAQTDCIIALTFLDIAAPSFGLGTCWAGFFMSAMKNWPPLQKALSLPDGNAPFGAMMIGYPKYRYQRLPLRDRAKLTWKE